MSESSQFPEQPPSPGAVPPPPPPPPSYGTPPPPPPPPSYGQPPAYGQQQYGQQAYGSPTPSYGGRRLAEWPQRAGAFVIDSFGPLIAVIIIGFVLSAISSTLGGLWFVLGYLAAIAWTFYNGYQAGQTGQSYGMQQFGIRLLREQDGQPIGGGMGIARMFIHVIDGLPCYVGWLWPLWDEKKQTFTDKVLTTVVIDERS